MDASMYRLDSIKYNIDTAIQLSMYFNDKETWEVISDVQSRLYEQFGIEE